MAKLSAGRFGYDFRAHFDPKFFDELAEFQNSLETGSKEWLKVEDKLVLALAETHAGLAKKDSRGPLSYRGEVGQPWVIPVRRLMKTRSGPKGRYYEGWRVKKIMRGVYVVTNEAPEAEFIEFGINPKATGQVRPRPILNDNAVKTLRIIENTRLAERFLDQTLGRLDQNRGQFSGYAAYGFKVLA